MGKSGEFVSLREAQHLGELPHQFGGWFKMVPAR
jgi:hypothetical protein